MGLRWQDWSAHALARLRAGCVIPAHPLALDAQRQLDPRRQRALSRYYPDAGAGGLAVGVHTTQFAIRDLGGLFEPVLALAAEEMDRRTWHVAPAGSRASAARRHQAVREAQLSRIRRIPCRPAVAWRAWRGASDDGALRHCRAVAEVIPLVGFYLQPAVGGPPALLRLLAAVREIDNVVAIKIAPFNRYQPRRRCARRRSSPGARVIALYTGNDDNIVLDLLTPFVFGATGGRRSAGSLADCSGHWAVWTRAPWISCGNARRSPSVGRLCDAGIAAAPSVEGDRQQRRLFRRRARLRG